VTGSFRSSMYLEMRLEKGGVAESHFTEMATEVSLAVDVALVSLEITKRLERFLAARARRVLLTMHGNHMNVECALHLECRVATMANKRRFGRMRDHMLPQMRRARETPSAHLTRQLADARGINLVALFASGTTRRRKLGVRPGCSSTRRVYFRVSG